MKRIILVAAASLVIIGAGCGKKASPNTNTNTATTSTPVEQAATTTPSEVVTTSTPVEETNSNTNTNTSTSVKPPATPRKTSFYVEADDSGFYPASGTATKGSLVTITFKVRTSNVIYNGLTIRSNKNDLGSIKGGTSKSVSFVADGNITFSSFWSTGAYRGAWTLYVK